MIPGQRILFCLLFFFVSGVAAADVPGSADHPLLSRYAGSNIIGYKQSAFDEYRLITGKVTTRGYMNPEVVMESEQDLEGKITRILYQAPKGRSTLEIYRNYETQLRKAGFEFLYQCSKAACGKPNSYLGKPWASGGWIRDVLSAPSDQRFLAARLPRKEGDVYVALYVVEHTLLNSLAGPYVQLDVVELKPMESEMVVVDAAALGRDLTAQGHVAVYGIYFDSDKADVKPESKPAIDEVAKLLRANPELRVILVGHTDNAGTLAYNLDLSKRRAEAVKAMLVHDYGIAADRLDAAGVGFLAPVASNRDAAGRAKNRRVEIVER